MDESTDIIIVASSAQTTTTHFLARQSPITTWLWGYSGMLQALTEKYSAFPGLIGISSKEKQAML
ncbi:MAG: hypothetical protein OEU92_04195 [Alphaproteobacteria bacterium]|nr:hypothetical protein [Alphaproteobacteria bacterium]